MSFLKEKFEDVLVTETTKVNSGGRIRAIIGGEGNGRSC